MSLVNMKSAQQIASMFLDIGAIKLSPTDPFTWASGWKSPIYCDGRLSLSFPYVRNYIKNVMIDTIRNNFSEVGAIAGVATAGIPQGILVADALDLPFLYVRPKAKDHGMENIIEGKIERGKRIVVIEDLISTGGSSLKAAVALDLAGYEIAGVIAVFSYGFETAQQTFSDAGILLYSLSNYDILLKEAVSKKIISNIELSSLQEWRKSPESWGK